ncbi:MAG TPA: DNA polymerase Y family protein [Burkholderiales bacterium]|nr:DNA polymerase Y family protein [Burkholderiales bacterium]
MLWVALHFPQFRRQALARGHAPPEPEREALAGLGAWACQFTPRVSLEPPQALLLEVEGSLRYFGGRWKFLARLREGLKALGFEARLAEAPAARAALWRARGDGGRLEAQPVAVMDLAPQAAALLAGLGVRTVGGLARLPREGLARRFEAGLLARLDQALGRAPEPRAFFAPPARFEARLEMPAPLREAGQALFAARRLLAQMEGFLAARQAGVRAFALELLHEDAPATRVDVGLAGAGREAAHFARLLRERLGALALRSPIEAIRLAAGALEPLAERSARLFDERPGGGEGWLRVIERLQARLGSAAVHGLDTHEDHRPERAFRQVDLRNEDLNQKERREKQGETLGLRPLWLLDPPRPLAEGEFALLAGPERVESGWWDGAEALRDYFIARTGEASLAWIYREREGSWFLHGYFA